MAACVSDSGRRRRAPGPDGNRLRLLLPALIASVPVALILALSPTTSTAQTPALGDLPEQGVALIVWPGGPVEALIDAAEAGGCEARSVWIASAGTLVGYIPGAPAFANAAWAQVMPGEIAAQTPLILACGASPAGPAPGSPSGALPALPAGWPSTLEVGTMDQPGAAAASATAAEGFGFRYHYLAGGANTGAGWATWNEGGSFATMFIEDSVAAGVIPVFSYYMIRQSSPGGSMSEIEGVLANAADAATMRAYFEDLRLFYQRAAAIGATVVLQVEPDFWGFLQQRAAGNDARNAPVRVGASGMPELAGLPDTLAGFAQAVLRLRDRYAPKVLVGYHISVWGTGTDIQLQDPPLAEVDALALKAADFYRSLGADFDLVFAEFTDRDAAFKQYEWGEGTAHWWDAGDHERFRRFLRGFSSGAHERVVLWQIPLGNTVMRAMDNTWNHYQDNRVEWLLGEGSRANLAAYRDAGVVALLFGRGADGATCACDAARDGVTDPPPIGGNTRASLSADDDGGYFKERVREYYREGPLPLR